MPGHDAARAPVLGVGMLALLLLAGTLTPAPRAQAQAPAERVFHGSWSAVGRRHMLPTEAGRPAAVVQLSGAIWMSDSDGASRGFQGEAIGFDDGASQSAGRAVWTDAHGDRLFSTLRGESLQTGHRIAGAITGGTGRYAGMTGEYTLTWQYVVAGDDDTVQGRAADLEGRLRPGERPR